MRITEITNSTEKLELLRMIDAAIWQAFDTERLYAEDEPADNAQDKAGQGVVATPAANQHANQVAAKPIAKQPSQKPAKQLTPTQQAHIKTLNPKQLLQYIKTNLKAPAPKPTTPIQPNSNSTSANMNTNNNNAPNSSFDTVNAKNDVDKNKADEKDRQA